MVVIGGRSGVGKSSVAHALHALLRDAGVQHAVVEGDALDLAWPAPWEHRLSMRNLTAIWANYRELGYRRLIYSNTVSVLEADELAGAMGDSPRITGVLLTASDEVVDARLAARESGEELAAHVERSARAARRLQADAPSWMPRIATDERTPAEVARTVADLLAW
nr:ATPase [Cellulomonas humilata]